jgi:hypothetical protein
MSPKSPKKSGWITDHKAARITGGLSLAAALVAGVFGFLKHSETPSPAHSVRGSNNYLVAVTNRQ